MGSAISSQGATLMFILFTYLLIVRALRYRRMRRLEQSFGYGTRKPLGDMTLDDAAAILLELSEMEFPFSFLNSTQFALFRVRDGKPRRGIASRVLCLVADEPPDLWHPHSIRSSCLHQSDHVT